MSNSKNGLRFITPTHRQSELPLLIFLPGMDGSGQLYQRQADRLANYFDIRCLAISPENTSDWDSLAKNAIALINEEIHQKSSLAPSPPLPIYLCGESFGGCLALKLTLEAPALFKKLILVNPSSSFNERPWLSWGIQITHWIPDFLHPISALTLLPFLAALEKISSEDRLALLRAMNSVPPHIVCWRLSLLRDFFVAEDDLRRIVQPTLIVASTRDRLLPSIQEAKRLNRYLPNAQTVILPESGHACLLETDIYLDDILQAECFLKPHALSDSDRAYSSLNGKDSFRAIDSN